MTWYNIGIIDNKDGFKLYHSGFAATYIGKKIVDQEEFIKYDQNIDYYKFNLKIARKRLINQCSALKQNSKNLSRQFNETVLGYTRQERLSKLYGLSREIEKHHRVTIWIRAITIALNYLNNKPFTFSGEKHYSDFKPRYVESILTSDYSKWSRTYSYYYGLEMVLSIAKILLKTKSTTIYNAYNQVTSYSFSNKIKMLYCHQKYIQTINTSATDDELKFENWILQKID